MRYTDWPERLARFLREEHTDWVAEWLAECGGEIAEEVHPSFAQRGDVVEFTDGMRICAGRFAYPGHVPMQALRAWRVD